MRNIADEVANKLTIQFPLAQSTTKSAESAQGGLVMHSREHKYANTIEVRATSLSYLSSIHEMPATRLRTDNAENQQGSPQSPRSASLFDSSRGSSGQSGTSPSGLHFDPIHDTG